jgi:serine phosphatase RsbU (regulator of sigma subunit)
LLSGKSGQTALEREEIELLRGLLNQASIALETNLLLDERTRQAELERELKIAASIQASLLPHHLEPASGWEVAAVCRPAREVGGDFYTELPGGVSGEHVLAYGDVSGKSISGALMMMAAHEVLNTLAVAHPDPEELFRLANERLYALRGDRRSGLQASSFVALGYLAFRPSIGTLRYSLAGQPPPMLRRNTSAVETLCMPEHRLPLGALRRGGHRVLEIELDPDDLLLAYSDGVVEAQSPEGDFFGEERLARALAEAPGSSPQDAVDHVLREIEVFTRGHTPYDDVTLLAARRIAGAFGS